MDWSPIFGTSWEELVEIFIRGSLMYLAIFVLIRVLRREAGGLSTPDLLVFVVIADAAQNGMSGQYTTIPPGVELVGVILGWSIALDAFAYRFEWLGRLVHPAPTILLKDGQLNRQNLRKNLISHEELMTAVRSAGLESLSQVKLAALEADGEVSIVPLQGN